MNVDFEILSRLTQQVISEAGGSHVDLKRGTATRLVEDLGLDSLMRVELANRIEQQLKLKIDETRLFSIETLGQLAEAFGQVDVTLIHTVASWDQDSEETFEPTQAQTLPQVLRSHVDQHDQRVHMRLQVGDVINTPITYGEIFNRARKIAKSLRAIGIEPGDRVALLLPTGTDLLESFLGILECGAAAVPLYPAAHPSQLLQHIKRQAILLDSCKAKLVITDQQIAVLANAMGKKIEVLTLNRLLKLGEANLSLEIRPDSLALLQYTSGSTGLPKGVMLSHSNLLANIRAFGKALEITSHDRCVSWLPLYHDMGLIGAWLGSLYFGVRLHLMSPLDFLARPVRWLRAISESQATISAAPNFAYHLCTKRIALEDSDNLQLSTWRAALNGAEPVTAAAMREFAQRFKSNGFNSNALLPVYGMAENSLALTIPKPGRGFETKRVIFNRSEITEDPSGQEFVGCGKVLDQHEIRIVNQAGAELPENWEGEIQYRGASSTKGYYANPDATKELFDGEWLKSGDRGFISGDQLYVTGRIKDIIIRAGRNIYPHLIEQIISGINGVRAGGVAVFAASDKIQASEKLIVVAETRLGDNKQRLELEQHIRSEVLEQDGTTLDQIILEPPGSVLKTSSGKVRRSAMRERFETGREFTNNFNLFSKIKLGSSLLAAKLGSFRHASFTLIYSAWVYCWAIVLVLLSVAFFVLAPSVPIRRKITSYLVRALCIIAGVKLTSDSKLPSQRTIYCINHSSYCDAMFLCAFLPSNTAFVAMRELEQVPLIGWYLKLLGTRFISRVGADSVEDISTLAQALKGNQSLAVFPEGTFIRREGLLPFKLGAFALAARENVSITPLHLNGTRKFLRPDQWMLRPSTIRLKIFGSITSDRQEWQNLVLFRDQVWDVLNGA